MKLRHKLQINSFWSNQDYSIIQQILKTRLEYVNFQCPKRLEEGEISVMAARTGKRYHPSCFRCQTCDVLLVDLIYFAHDNQVRNFLKSNFYYQKLNFLEDIDNVSMVNTYSQFYIINNNPNIFRFVKNVR